VTECFIFPSHCFTSTMPFTPERDSTVNESAGLEPALNESPVRHRPLRPKKPPPITPRRFTKFFTPRLFHGHRSVRTSRTALQNISGPTLNERANHKHHHRVEHEGSAHLPPAKPRGRKRKLSFISGESTPHKSTAFFLPSSQEVPDDHAATPALVSRSPSRQVDIFEDDDRLDEETTEGEEDDLDTNDKETCPLPSRPAVRQYRAIGTSTGLLSARLSGRITRIEPCRSNLWQHQTSAFYSAPSDVYSCTSLQGPAMTLPFCSASCNTNSLTAIGDEQGGIRLLDSAIGNRDGFTKHHLALQNVHNNAVMDLTFSHDDALLATASGDQESHIVDMRTQQTMYRLCGHTASVKRVQFQPGSSSNVLATCSRDGNINIWDLRSHADRPSLHLRSSPCAQLNGGLPAHPPANYIRAAHTASYAKYRNADEATIEWARKRGRYNDSSVTSLAFLPDPGRSHLLFSGSEADSTIKVWDMRTIYNARRPRPHPISTTEEAPNHQLHRRYGLTSLAFSGDGARLYSLCRDHTVYVYSTSHLILGDAPELSMTTTRPRRPGGPERPGLGPLYALRHPKFSVSTFYLKLAVRKASAENPELLAVGSSDNCAVIFPTSERYLNSGTRRISRSGSCFGSESADYVQYERSQGRLNRKSAEPSTTSTQEYHSLPIYKHGTALIRGHEKEVTAVTWNHDGSLTTVSDDFTARCWREDSTIARHLRRDGESGGRRWMAGWADVSDKAYDDEE
jgi:WD40 repeat protein